MIGAALALLLAAAPEAGNLCTLCHPDVRVEFERSIHHSENVTCTSCHGGDPSASSVDAAHRGRFRGRIARKDVPEACAVCHADTSMMRPYNLPTDQLALYLTSGHGRALARGDGNAAVCTDCHGVHAILPPENVESSVHVLNIPRTCARCHSDAELMRPYGFTEDPFAEFTLGIHGRALLEEGNQAAPECSRCHSAHGAAPTGVGDIDKVCGQCHASARAYFLEGPHKAAMVAAGLPECASCHGHHRIRTVDVSMIDALCADCHAKDSAEVELGLKMRTLYEAAAADIDEAREIVDRAAAIPLYTEDYEARLNEARTSLIESVPAMHSLNLEHVQDLTRRARAIGNEVESEAGGKLESRKWRRVGLMVFWFYLLVTVGILARFRRNAARQIAP